MYLDFNEKRYLSEFIGTLDSKIRHIIDTIDKNEKLLECLSVQIDTLTKLISNPALIPTNIEVVIKIIKFYQTNLEKYNGPFVFDASIVEDIYLGYFEEGTMRVIAQTLKELKERLSGISQNTSLFIKKQQYFKNKTMSVFNMLRLDEKGELVVPIESRSSINLINSVMIDCKYKINDRNMILMDINHLNLKALQARDKILEIRKNELLKQEAKSLISSDKKILVETTEQKILGLGEEQQIVIDRLVEILSENSGYISMGYSEDVITGYELLMSTENKDYFLDPDSNVNLGIILRVIQEYLSYDKNKIGDKTLSDFKSAIYAYEKCIEMIQENNKTVEEHQQLLVENEETLAMADACMKKFKRLKERLLPTDLNIIKSIDAHIEVVTKPEEDDSKEDEFEQIATFIENLTAGNQRLSHDIYYMYKKLETIESIYLIFQSELDIGFKKNILISLSHAIEDYIQYAGSLSDNQELEPTKENQNNVIYLMGEEGENLFINYIKKDNTNYTAKNYKIMKDYVKTWLNNRNENDIFLKSTKVKDSVYDEKIRRIRISDYRIVYINLNNIADMSLPLEKNCYVAIAVGRKSGDFDIYKFANSKEVKDALIHLYKVIMAEVESIDKSNMSSEQKAAAKNKFIEDYVMSNNRKFEQMLDSQIQSLKENSQEGIKMG